MLASGFVLLFLGAALLTPPARGQSSGDRLAADPTFVRGLLETGRHDELEQALAEIEDASRADPAAEDVYWAAYNYLAQPRATNEPLFDKWVAASKKPFRARLARAMFLEKRGWRARGGRWAQETTTAQFRRMDDYHSEAAREYVALTKEDPGSALAWDGVISTCIARGDNQCSTRAVREGLARSPASFNLRAAHMYALKPKWGGSYEAMRAFARDAQAKVARNPRLRHLLGYADAERAAEAGRQVRWSDAVQLYTLALAHGPEPVFLSERALAYYYAGQPEKALEDIRAARNLSPAGWFFSDIRLAHTYALEGGIAYQAGRRDEARRLVGRAVLIEIDSDWLLEWARFVAR